MTGLKIEPRGTHSLDGEEILPDMVLEEYRHQDGTTTKLCKRCTSMTSTLEGLTALASEDGYVHYGLKKLEQSMKRGCKCCTMLAEGKDSLEDNLDEEAYSLILKADLSEDHPFNLMPHSLANDSIIKKIKGHLYDCKSRHGEHEGCPGGVTPFLPSRVIHVGTHAKSNIFVDSISGQTEYVALSYCWGGDQLVKLEARHILDGKPWHLPQDLLPQTISDAIITNRNLVRSTHKESYLSQAIVYLLLLAWGMSSSGHGETIIWSVFGRRFELEYHAPSWSWLSMPEGVQIDMPGGVPNFGTNKFTPHATLKSYFIKPKYPSLSPLGKVLSAAVTLDAITVPYARLSDFYHTMKFETA
ncbi:hypothetical protein N431DRAFT_471824 [Stipitochalara longipes BDJ]|nr:hypothetical protein N431DRAFT_471824 [Stipitochalara longipes BDJ]